MKKKLFKVLNSDLRSPYQNFQFELGKEYHCDDFDEDPKHDCSNGFYATDIEGLPYSFNTNRKVFECEVSGKKVEINQYKCRYENFELIKEIPFNIIKQEALSIETKIGYKLSEVLFPVDPLLILNKNLSKIELIKCLKDWASVRDSMRASVGDSVWDSVWASVRASVGGSVWDSVWNSVRASVGASVWDSVWDSVRASVRDSVWAYISFLFPNIKQWQYIDHKKGINPFQPAIDLWNAGYIVSFDGNLWRVHTDKDAKIILTINKNEL
jgi:hypothetical protein